MALQSGRSIVDELRESFSNPFQGGAKPKATRQLVRGPNGKVYVQFVDIATGKPITDLTGYELVETRGDWTNPTVSREALPEFGEGLETPVNQLADDETIDAFEILRDGDEGSEATDGLDTGPRQALDNFGYISTPRALGYTNYVPGPIGTASKLVNTAINANNVQAVDAARTYVGLPSLSKGQVAGGIVGTNDYDDGLVADAVINDHVYGVGFEALTPDGRTTLTPEEARRRSETAPSRARLATEEERSQNRRQFDADAPQKGVKSAVQEIGRSIGRALGWSPEETEKTVQTSLRAVETTEYRGKPLGSEVRPSALQTSEPSKVSSSKGRRGGGLADVSPSFNPVDNRSTTTQGVNWGSVDPRDLDPSIRGVIDNASRQLGFGLNITSGARSPSKNAAVGGAQGSAHMTGKAVDISLKGLTDPQRTALVGTLQGIAQDTSVRIGAYSGNTGLHVDTATHTAKGQRFDDGGVYGPAYEMFDRTKNLVEYGPDWFQAGFTPLPDTKSIPTPTPRTAPADELVSEPVSDQPVKAAEIGQPSRQSQVAADLSPAQLSAAGYGPTRTPEQRERIAETLAGELSPSSLKGLREGAPEAMKEFSAAMSTIENRAQSQRYASLDDPIGAVTNPTDYNSNLASNRRTTVGNFGLYGDDLKAAVDGFYAGRIEVTAPEATHYYNADIVKPSWGSALQNPATIGAHRFGSLPGEYKEASLTASARNEYASDITPNPDRAAPVGAVERAALGPVNPGYRDPSERVSSAFSDTRPSGFAGSAGSARSMSAADDSFDGYTPSGFAGSSGSFRSQEGHLGGIGNTQMADRGGRLGSDPSPSSSGFAGPSGSARSASRDDSAFDGEGIGSGSKSSSGGFAGSSGSARSNSRGDSSYDGGRSEGSRASSKSSGGFAGSSGSPRSNSQGDKSFDGGSKTSSANKGSGGFAGSSGSPRSNSQGDSNYDGGSASKSGGSGKSSGSSSGGSAKGSNGTNAGSDNKGGLGGWGGH